MAKWSRPTEISAKQPVSVLREVVPVVKKKAIDPRFDRSFGSFNEDLFKKSYEFIGEMQKDETTLLKSSLKKERSSSKRAAIKSALDKITSMKRTNTMKEERQALIREHRKMESKLIEEGKTPYFLKKRDIKTLETAKEFDKVKERIKDDAALERFIEKKRKRKASKQRKFMPRSQEQEQD